MFLRFVPLNLGSVWFGCIPSFNLLLYLELVKKFIVVVGGNESNFIVHLWSKPYNLQNNQTPPY